jgi:hypothetical protein
MSKSTIKPTNHKLISHLIEEGKWPFPVTTNFKPYLAAKDNYNKKQIIAKVSARKSKNNYPDNSIGLF